MNAENESCFSSLPSAKSRSGVIMSTVTMPGSRTAVFSISARESVATSPPAVFSFPIRRGLRFPALSADSTWTRDTSYYFTEVVTRAHGLNGGNIIGKQVDRRPRQDES